MAAALASDGSCQALSGDDERQVPGQEAVTAAPRLL